MPTRVPWRMGDRTHPSLRWARLHPTGPPDQSAVHPPSDAGAAVVHQPWEAPAPSPSLPGPPALFQLHEVALAPAPAPVVAEDLALALAPVIALAAARLVALEAAADPAGVVVAQLSAPDHAVAPLPVVVVVGRCDREAVPAMKLCCGSWNYSAPGSSESALSPS